VPQTASTTRQEAAAQNRARVLVAARQLFVNSGFDAVKASDIARAAGVAHGSVFHHFGSKQALYEAVVCEIGREMIALHVTDPAIPLGQRIRQSHAAHLNYLATHRDVALHLGLRPTPTQLSGPEAIRDEGNRVLAENLGLDFDLPAVRLAVRLYNAAADQLAMDYLTSPHGFEPDDVVEALVTVLTGALRAVEVLDPSQALGPVIEALDQR